MLVWKIFTKQLELSEFLGVKKFINAILANKEEFTYYFMFDILGIYLTIPLLSLVAKKENIKTLWLTIILYFIFNATLTNILPLIGITYNNSFTVQIGGYIVYVLLGYVLSTQDLTRRQKSAIYISAILGLIYRYVTTFILSKESGTVIRTTWGYCSWHCVLLASAVFVFIKGLKIDSKLENKTKITTVLAKVSSCSFGIYLIHKIVMYYEIYLLNINEAMWQWRTFGIVTTYIISLIIVLILKKIPIVKKIVP